ITQRRLHAYAQVLGDSDLAWIANSDLFWDEIISIEPIGDQQVYDLTVPDGANFIAGDVCVHNTALALQIAHAAARAGQHVGYFSLEMSTKQILQRLLAQSAGVDLHRLTHGYLHEAEWQRVLDAQGRLA